MAWTEICFVRQPQIYWMSDCQNGVKTASADIHEFTDWVLAEKWPKSPSPLFNKITLIYDTVLFNNTISINNQVLSYAWKKFSEFCMQFQGISNLLSIPPRRLVRICIAILHVSIFLHRFSLQFDKTMTTRSGNLKVGKK